MNKLVVVLVAGVVGLGTICVMQHRSLRSRAAEVAALETERDEQAGQIESLKNEQTRLAEQKRALLQQAEEMAGLLQTQQAAASNRLALADTPITPAPAPAAPKETAGDEKGGLGKFLSKMMQDPDTRKFIRQQQRTMMDQLYSPLVKRMGLSTEEADQFKELLTENMMKGADKASSMLGEQSSTNRAEVAKTIAAEEKSFDDQLKAFLGEDRYAAYKDYQETAGERMQLNLFKQQNGMDNFLTDPQTEQLLAIMKEEKKNVSSASGQPLAGLNGLGQNQADFASLSDEQIEKLLHSQDTVNQRVYQRAQTFLSPDQMSGLGKFQTNQTEMMRMGMTMARKFLAPDKPTETAGPAQ